MAVKDCIYDTKIINYLIILLIIISVITT